MIKLFDRVKVNIPTTGTGDITFGAAASTAFLTPAEAGVLDGDEVRYVIVDGLDFEEGVGLIKDTVAMMERTVTKSKIGGVVGTSPINLSGTAVMALTASAADIGDMKGPSGATDGNIVTFDGATGKLVKDSGVKISDLATAGHTLLRVTTFTTSGTWTPHPDAALVNMICVGGGGGGGGSAGGTSTQVGCGSGGGGGGYQERTLTAGWGATETVTVGAGGDGKTGDWTVGNGDTGGTSSVGTLCVATGGQGGGGSGPIGVASRGAGPAPAGGSGSGSGGVSGGVDIIIPGGPGNIGIAWGGSSPVALAGKGGDSAMGFGGAGATEGNNGNNGNNYGGGGSGASGLTTSKKGGDGAPGIVIITEWS